MHRESRLRTDQLHLHVATSRLAQDVQESTADFIRVIPIPARVGPPSPPDQPTRSP